MISTSWVGRHAVILASGTLVAMGLLLRPTPLGSYAGILLLLMLATAGLVWASHRSLALAAILAAAFVARAGLALLDSTVPFLPKADQGHYYGLAVQLSTAWWQGHEVPLGPTDTGAYVRLISPLFFVFGPHPLLPRFVSALAGVGSVALLYGITKRLYSEKVALVAAAAYALYPSAVQIQSEILRDPMIVFMILACVWFCLDGLPPDWSSRALLASSAITLMLLRPPGAALTFALLAALVIWRTRPRTGTTSDRQVTIRRLRIRLSLASAGALGLALYFGRRYVGTILDLERLNYIRSTTARGGSAYLAGVTFSNLIDVALFAPIGAFYFLFTPFPWQVHNVLSFLAAAENLLVLYPFVIMIIWTRGLAFRDGRAWLLLAFMIGGALLFGLVEGNVGTALRHRTMFSWVFVVLAAPGLSRLASRLPLSATVRRALDEGQRIADPLPRPR